MKKQHRKWRLRPIPGNPDFVMATADGMRRAVERFDPAAGWEAVAGSLVPLLPRNTPSPVRAGAPIQAYLPPGIPVSFGIDMGPLIAVVTREVADRWGVEATAVAKTALDNIRALAAELPPEVVTEVPLDDGTKAQILQSRAGWASAILLLPDLLPRFIGAGPHLVGAPCRDVVIAFPESTPLDLVASIVESISMADPSGIAVGAFRHWAGSLEAAPYPRHHVLADVALEPRPIGPMPS